MAIESSTGTSIKTYIKWLEEELSKRAWGEVTISFKICDGFVTDVRKEAVDTEHHSMPKK